MSDEKLSKRSKSKSKNKKCRKKCNNDISEGGKNLISIGGNW